MSPNVIYRIVAVLIVLYAAGHTLGFRRVDPAWGVDAPVNALKTITFTAQRAPNRTYWGFYLGFGYFCSVLLLFSAALAWQLGSLAAPTLRELQFLSWSFAAAFAATAWVTWIYFFTAPVAFSILITLGLIAGAWLARGA